MKRLTTALLLLGTLTGCSYASSEQAMDACKEWEAKGEVIPYKQLGKDGVTYNLSDRNRTCFNAYWDKHIIGYYGEFDDDDRAKEGKLLKESDIPQVEGLNKKYFRYWFEHLLQFINA